jgi:hypothetical protein
MWQPIETARKDAPIWARGPRESCFYPYVAQWQGDRWAMPRGPGVSVSLEPQPVDWQPMEWRPIETARKTGDRILLSDGRTIRFGYDDPGEAKSWMPVLNDQPAW